MVEIQPSSEMTSSLSSRPDTIDNETNVVGQKMESESASIGPSIVDEVQASAKKESPTEIHPESTYITGWSLSAVLAGLTLVVFLSMLDQTIVVTVSVSLLFGLFSLLTDK